MSTESKELLSNVSDVTTGTAYGSKNKGAGYHTFNDGLHTVVYEFDNFVGSVKIQATLALYPGDSDWFDVPNTLVTVEDSTPLISNETVNFTGKFLWLRAAYTLDQGTISKIRYNY
jgi:hypothetical protein